MALFKCNLPNCTIRRIRFEGGYFSTTDPEQIEFLRDYKTQGGITVTEEKEEEKAEDPKANDAASQEEGSQGVDISAILASIEACENQEAINAYITYLVEKYPEGKGIPEADREVIAQALNAKTDSFASDVEESAGKDEQAEAAGENATSADSSPAPDADAVLAEAKHKQSKGKSKGKAKGKK